MNKINTPLLFIVFNRPDLTIKVFEKIRQAKHPKLYIACDGPRVGHDGEKEKVDQVREIAGKVDWQCELKLCFKITI